MLKFINDVYVMDYFEIAEIIVVLRHQSTGLRNGLHNKKNQTLFPNTRVIFNR